MPRECQSSNIECANELSQRPLNRFGWFRVYDVHAKNLGESDKWRQFSKINSSVTPTAKSRSLYFRNVFSFLFFLFFEKGFHACMEKLHNSRGIRKPTDTCIGKRLRECFYTIAGLSDSSYLSCSVQISQLKTRC